MDTKIITALKKKQYPKIKGFQINQVVIQTTADAYSKERQFRMNRNEYQIVVSYEINGIKGNIALRSTWSAKTLPQVSYFPDYLKYKYNDRMIMDSVNCRHFSYGQPPTSLPDEVHTFIVCLIDEFLPLGIPTADHLVKIKELLRQIKEVIDKNEATDNLSDQFYQMVVHKGNEQRRPVFTVDVFNMKKKFVECMELTVKALHNARLKKDNSIDHFVIKFLRAEITVVDDESEEFQVLNEVVENTQHSNCPRQFRLDEVFKVSLNKKFHSKTSNHHYLLHYTFPNNLLGILRDGLLVAPDHIDSVLRRFGKGIYFWNAVANAGPQYASMKTIYIVVCRVALGRIEKLSNSFKITEIKAILQKTGADSGFREGCYSAYRTVRDKEINLNGANIFTGQIGNTHNKKKSWNNYDEYVVASADQVKVEFILKLKKIYN